MAEYRLTPAEVRAAPGRLRIIAHNFGRLVHNLAVLRDGKLVAATRPIRPGSRAVLTLTVSTGTYTLTSTLLEDQSLGIEATLEVG